MEGGTCSYFRLTQWWHNCLPSIQDNCTLVGLTFRLLYWHTCQWLSASLNCDSISQFSQQTNEHQWVRQLHNDCLMVFVLKCREIMRLHGTFFSFFVFLLLDSFNYINVRHPRYSRYICVTISIEQSQYVLRLNT